MKKLLFLLALLQCAGWATAQSTLQVVTKTEQKSIKWRPGYAVEIICEKADIEVAAECSGDNNVFVKVEMVARHPQLDSARHDIAAWKFVTSTVGKKIYIRAYIGLPAGQSLPNSNLKVKISIQVPVQCPVTLSNKFGKARLEHLNGAIRLKGEFCNFTLIDLHGGVRLESQYGNVDGKQLTGMVDLQTKRSAISLSALKGDCSVHSEYGAVAIETSAQTGNLYIQSNKGDVTLLTGASINHNYTLTTNYGELQVPATHHFSTSSNGNSKLATLQKGVGSPQVTVETTFGKITVQ